MPMTKKRRRPAEVISKTSNGHPPKSLLEEVAQWMIETSPTLSVDVLLTRPLDAISMALNVGARLKRIPDDLASSLNVTLRDLRRHHASSVEAINEICRAAMNARKRGLLKPQAHTRKEKSHAGTSLRA